MGRIAVLGESVRVEAFALAGAVVCVAEDPAAVREAWACLPADIAVVVVTPAAAAALADGRAAPRDGVLTVTMP